MPISVVPIYSDNYVSIIHNDREAVVVDPGIYEHIETFLIENRLTVVAILVTHHHWDHTDGVAEMAERYDAPVYGSSDSRCGATKIVAEGDTIEVGAFRFDVLETPGHTTSHLCYYAPTEGAVFTGDTLFSCGCGRLFEGTPQQMTHSFHKLLSLPEETRIYFAHEYTTDNIRFALSVEPHNKNLLAYEEELKCLKRSIPSSIKREKECNPFCRLNSPELRSNLQIPTEAHLWEVFRKLRSLKDSF